MKFVLQIIGLAALLTTFAAPARAVDWYAGGGAGGFGFDVTIAGFGNDSGFGPGGFAVLGGDINDYLGAELRFGTTDNVPVFGLDYKWDAFLSLMAKVQFNIVSPNGPRVYGLVGGTSANIRTTAGLNEIETGLSYGAGIEYQLTPDPWAGAAYEVWIGAEYVRYWDNVPIIGVAGITVDAAALTLKWYIP